jgi:ADP-ribose pyrophosphatase YjhB (NUDIX family)
MLQFDDLSTLPVARRWREQLYPAPIVVAIIRHADSYLLIQRNSDPYHGMWALVGGKWDFGEELGTAVTREVKEETSLDTRFVALRGLVNERLINDGTADHFLLFVCEVVVENGHASEQKEGAVAWFNRAQLEDLYSQNAIIPSDYAMCAEFATAIQAASVVEVEMWGANEETELRRFERMNN